MKCGCSIYTYERRVSFGSGPDIAYVRRHSARERSSAGLKLKFHPRRETINFFSRARNGKRARTVLYLHNKCCGPVRRKKFRVVPEINFVQNDDINESEIIQYFCYYCLALENS